MTSQRKSAANRINAGSSTGPRSAAGKKRVSGNAVKHRLTTSILLDPDFTDQVELLATQISRDCNLPLAKARLIAEQHHNGLRAKAAKATMINLYRRKRFAKKLSASYNGDLIEGLRKLQRYDDRAWTRKTKLIRGLASHC